MQNACARLKPALDRMERARTTDVPPRRSRAASSAAAPSAERGSDRGGGSPPLGVPMGKLRRRASKELAKADGAASAAQSEHAAAAAAAASSASLFAFPEPLGACHPAAQKGRAPRCVGTDAGAVAAAARPPRPSSAKLRAPSLGNGGLAGGGLQRSPSLTRAAGTFGRRPQAAEQSAGQRPEAAAAQQLGDLLGLRRGDR